MRERISIHAPHEGERPDGADNITDLAHISIHAPHEGERLLRLRGVAVKGAFQSTLPTRGSDLVTDALKGEDTDFNPRSPRGGATQAPRHKGRGQLFQSTLPTRGSDYFAMRCILAAVISIHAPHEGERRRKSAFVCSISANLLNIIHCGTVTRAVSRRRIALFRLFSVRRSDVFMYAYASH